VRDAADLNRAKEAGFNAVVGPATREFLDAAQALDLRVMAMPGTMSGTDFQASIASEIVRSFDTHPALWSWYLVDEPGLHRTPPWKVAMDLRRLKSSQARQPVSLTLYNGRFARDYGHLPDLLMVDQYPIPWMPLSHFSQHLGWARAGADKETPVFAVLQAFDWKYFQHRVPGVTHFRSPTQAELQCMAFMAVAQGMQGLFFYSLKAGEWDLLKHPDVWDAVRQVVQTLHTHGYLFASTRQWWVPVQETLPYELRRNASLEPAISTTFLEDPDGLTHLLLINTTPHDLTMDLALPESSNRWMSGLEQDTPFGGFRPGATYQFPFAEYQVRLLKGYHSLESPLP